MNTNTLYNGDCLEIMKTIPDKSIDLILCDLPYGITKNKWDIPLPLDLLWKEYWRISKGAIVLFSQNIFTARLMVSEEKYYRYTLIWEKPNAVGFLNARRMPLQAHEDICVFYKKLPIYNPQMSEGKPYKIKRITNGDGKNYGKFERVGHIQVNNGERFPRTVIKITNDKYKSLHPTQKPIELLEYLIKTYTHEDMVVLDNCMGSGSTCVAAINSNRKFIGIEKDEKYFQIADARIRTTMEMNDSKKLFDFKSTD